MTAATLCLTFDNLGEAAEIELGAIPEDAELGGHPTATRVVPEILGMLAERGLAATFFVEGLNAETYPELLRRIDSEGHEVGLHAWRHEQWDGLSAAEQAEKLERGGRAFAEIGIEAKGLRPPGGALGDGGVEVPAEAGLAYCSPAGSGLGFEAAGTAGSGVALIPFEWRHVDASCLLPPLAGVREEIAGSPDPIEPDRFLAHLETELERIVAGRGFASFVLHPVTVDAWFGEQRLAALLDRVVEHASRGELRVATCAAVAEEVIADPRSHTGGTTLDATSWV